MLLVCADVNGTDGCGGVGNGVRVMGRCMIEDDLPKKKEMKSGVLKICSWWARRPLLIGMLRFILLDP